MATVSRLLCGRQLARSVAAVFAAAVGAGVALAILAGTGGAHAQEFSIDLGGGEGGGDGGVFQGGELTGRVVQLIALLTVLSIAPSILVMVTSFTRIVVVLSFLRSALATQQTPPNSVLIALALFLSAFVMMPTFERAYQNGVLPLINEEISEQQAWERTVAPFEDFMLANVRQDDLELFVGMLDEETRQEVDTPEAAPLRALIPAFMISELRRAFEIGFLLFIPFLIIDMTVASVLMSMGMMMLPPIIVSLPFKIIFFVLVDGWYLVAGSLMESFNQIPGAS